MLGPIARVAETSMQLAGPNLVKGFPAAAVDLGRLQATLERGLARFDPAQVEARWSEIFDWFTSLIGAWVQRCKHMKIDRFEKGIRIELTTQDDLGYYDYAFDIFPRRAGTRTRK